MPFACTSVSGPNTQQLVNQFALCFEETRQILIFPEFGNQEVVQMDPTFNSHKTKMEKALMPVLAMYKNHLQEYTQRSRMPFPVYETINEGFQHAPKFRARVTVNGRTFTSGLTFPHLKEAEQHAAKVALECLKELMKNVGCSVVNEDLKQCKLILNEFAFKANYGRPKYTTIQLERLRPVYLSSVLFDGKTFTSEIAKSKKEAEQMAARKAIQSILASGSEILVQILSSKNKIIDDLKIRQTELQVAGMPGKSSKQASEPEPGDQQPSCALTLRAPSPSMDSNSQNKRKLECPNTYRRQKLQSLKI